LSGDAAHWQRVLDLALRLPGVDVGSCYGTPALRVRGKLMARLWEDGETLVVKTNPFTRNYLLESDPGSYFLTDHYRDHAWVLVRLTAVTDERLGERLDEAWRLVAPKRLVADHDASG
jgi:hypothetical protein